MVAVVQMRLAVLLQEARAETAVREYQHPLKVYQAILQAAVVVVRLQAVQAARVVVVMVEHHLQMPAPIQAAVVVAGEIQEMLATLGQV